jgi:hypothetical protein
MFLYIIFNYILSIYRIILPPVARSPQRHLTLAGEVEQRKGDGLRALKMYVLML